MTVTQGYSWLRQIPKELLDLTPDQLYGNAPPFDLEAFVSTLSTALSLPIQIKVSEADPKSTQHLKEGFSESTPLYAFKLAPLSGYFFLVIPNELFKSIAERELPGHKHHDPALIDALKEFVIAQALTAFQKGHSDKTLVPQYAPEGTLEEIPHLAREIEVSIEGKNFPIRLLLSQQLMDAWRKKFASPPISPSQYNNLFVTISIEAGRTSIKRQDFKLLEKGDFLLLDSCHLVPGEEKAKVVLTFNGRPIFRGKLKEGQIKILEYPLLYEDKHLMAKDPLHDEELEEEYHDDTSEEYEEDEATDEEASEEEPSSSESIQKIAPQKPIKADEVPLEVIVEVGRIKLTVQKLSELKPGQVLDLNFRPEDGVDLVVNGHFVAKAELLKVGDLLGVRILDIAN